MIDLARIRQYLIDERERQEWTQTQLAKRAGVRQGQISRLEDLSQPLSDLAARVLFRVIEDGFGFTLSSFFKQFEGQTKGDLPPRAIEGRTADAPEGAAGNHARQNRAVPIETSSLLAAGDALVEAGGRLIAAASGIEVGKSPRAPARVRAKKPAKGPRRAANG